MKTYFQYFGLCALIGAPIGAATSATATPPCQRPVIVATLSLRSSTVDGAGGVVSGPATNVTLTRGESYHELRGAADGAVLRFLPSEEP